jgi:flotillin
MSLILLGVIAVAGLAALTVFLALVFRRVVPANMVHIVQSGRKTVSYGVGGNTGNTYYAWPSWVPVLGVSVSTFPVSNFDIRLSGYEGYDKGRLPFVVDIMAFFRITDSNKAAQRVSTFGELQEQLTGILQGAVRRILATNELEHIMQDRSQLGNEFTAEVEAQVAEWGVATVKAIEFMDIRDSQQSKVIHNIMAKEQSRIDQESRVAVAENRQKAETAEIESKRQVDIEAQNAAQIVGIREAEKEKLVGIARETSKQEVTASMKTTTEREMEVTRVSTLRGAEIEKERAIVAADTYHETKVRNANADLEATKAAAAGVVETGKAEGEAETARLLAPVTAQAKLAADIGENQSYQQYLVTIRQVEANQAVGVEMARSIGKADLKVIANGGDIGSGMTSLTDMLSSAGGTKLGAMLTGLTQTDEGKALVDGAVKKLAL